MDPAWPVWAGRPACEAIGQVLRYQLYYIAELNNPAQGESANAMTLYQLHTL
jgi:hypothetical protein